jgi:endonuclease/exonuclease/phosphatase family metal-dependent hydrolase
MAAALEQRDPPRQVLDSPAVIVATHNLMEGHNLDALIHHHRGLHREVGLDVLCVQESRGDGDHFAAARIARALGPGHVHVGGDPIFGLGIVYDARRLDLVASALFPLPPVPAMRWHERRFILDGRPERMWALWARFAGISGAPFTVVDLHLDTVGGTRQRRRQVVAAVEHLRAHGFTERVVVAGDTNAFAATHGRHRRALRRVLEPLRELGAVDPSTTPTHFFARQHEPKFAHRVCVALGKLGLDLPQRFDVVATDLPVRRRGQLTTPESDHDLVWAELDTASR